MKVMYLHDKGVKEIYDQLIVNEQIEVYNKQKKFGILPADIRQEDIDFSLSTLKEK